MVLRKQNRRLSVESLEVRRLMTADLNGDGRVEFADFLILSDAYGDQVPMFGERGADIDGNGVVDFPDFLILSANYGATVVDVNLVPYTEPTNPEEFVATVTTREQWNDLVERTNPGREPVEPPVSFEESSLIFRSFGERGLGIWTEVDWVTVQENHLEVGYRYIFGGAAPPPGTQVITMLLSVPRVTDPMVRFVELESIPLP